MSSPAPRFFSLEFHFRFLPGVIWRRLRGGSEADRPSFAHHVIIELPVLLVGCCVLLAIGVPLALGAQPVLGWAMAVLGLGGIIFLVIHSILSRPPGRPSFETFHVMVFLFCVLLGLTAGMIEAPAPWLRLPCAAAGALAGYGLGIFAGLWVEYLGWIALVPDLLAVAGAAGLAIFDVLSIWL